MASPHVAGAVALRLQTKPSSTPAENAGWVTKTATRGAVRDPKPCSPNALRYVGPGLFHTFLTQTGTALHQTDSTVEFEAGDYNRDGVLDLYAIKKSATGTGRTEVHVLNGADNYQTFLLHIGTAQHQTDATFEFELGDYNGDGVLDLYAIKKSATGTGRTEVHVLNGADNYQTFLLHIGTPQHQTDSTFEFTSGDYNRDGRPDLWAIKKSATGTHSTEVHILNGADNYQTFLTHFRSVLHETDSSFEFEAGDYDRDGRSDLWAIKKSATGTSRTEVHVLSGATNFSSYLVQTATALHQTPSGFSFELGDRNRDRRLDLVAVKMNATGTASTELHILDSD